MKPYPSSHQGEVERTPAKTERERTGSFLGFERNVLAASAALCLIFFGEELWKKFLPRYLVSLGAGAVAVGMFGTTRYFFFAIYQYLGGWMADRPGRQRSLRLFIVLASTGYLIYLFSSSWPFMFVGI